MACTSSSSSFNLEDERKPLLNLRSSSSPAVESLSQRRRHSSYQAIRRRSSDLDADAIFMKVGVEVEPII